MECQWRPASRGILAACAGWLVHDGGSDAATDPAGAGRGVCSCGGRVGGTYVTFLDGERGVDASVVAIACSKQNRECAMADEIVRVPDGDGEG